MPTSNRPAVDFTPEQLRFPSIPGFTVRADFTGGELSSDFGAVVLGAVDHRIGLLNRLMVAINDTSDARRDLLLSISALFASDQHESLPIVLMLV